MVGTQLSAVSQGTDREETATRQTAAPGPKKLTVLGVDGHDPRLHTELHRFVPEGADAIYPLAIPPSEVNVHDVLVAGLYNPPATTAALVRRGVRTARGPSLQSGAAIESIARNRSLPLRKLAVDGFEQVPGQSPLWTITAWLLTALIVATIGALVMVGGPAAIALVPMVLAVTVSFVLAHAGAHLALRDEVIGRTVRGLAAAHDDRHPVVVVPERHAPGIAADAKDDLIDATARTVSSELTVDESLY